MRILHTLALVVLLSALCGCSSSPSVADAPEYDALRVLTYNIHHGEGVDGVLDLERIAAVITESGADLVALQEVDVRAARTGSVDQLDTLARLTGMTGVFTPFMDFQGGQYGLAVLSRYPIQRAWPIELPPGTLEPRSALAVEVMIPGHASVTFVSLHLDWLGDDAERYAQARALVAGLEDEHSVILAGDFNDRPGSRTNELFERTYVNTPKPRGASSTFPAPGPPAEIDFVMYRPAFGFAGTAAVLGETTASDHRPVLATLEWVR
jgi:endonuclease/exonuclease/phosphatase family metal-dependent hydrolase